MKKFLIASIALMTLMHHALGQQKDYPDRPIKVIVPTAAGATADVTARFFAQRMAAILGQPVVIENKPGANGVLGVMAVKTAPADGYTVLLSTISTSSVNPIAVKNLPYDPVTDFRPVRGLLHGTNVLVVAGDSKVQSLRDLAAASKQTAGGLNFAYSFPGYRLDAEWLGGLAGINFNYVLYKGNSQVLTDIIGHHADVTIVDLGVAGSLMKAGQVKPLATAGKTRHPDWPQVPTVAESGYPEFASSGWVAFYVRSDTPNHVVARLAEATRRVQDTDETRDFVKKLSAQPLMLDAEELRKFHMEELARFRRIAATAGITPQ